MLLPKVSRGISLEMLQSEDGFAFGRQPLDVFVNELSQVGFALHEERFTNTGEFVRSGGGGHGEGELFDLPFV